MSILTSQSENEQLRYHFLAKTEPWLALIRDSESGTKVEICREGGSEEFLFRTQGELVASYKSEPDQDPLLQVYAPSPDVDLLLFAEKMKEIYEIFPELVVYLREGFSETPQELVALATNPGDRAVMTAIFAVEPNVGGTETCPDCGDDLDSSKHTCSEYLI